MQAPWWTTIAAAAAGGIIALLATILTSGMNALTSRRRQRLELAHTRSLEREKLLYDQRIELYLNIIEEMFQVDNKLRELRRDCTALNSIYLTTELKELAHSVQSDAANLSGKLSKIIILSDREVVDAFMDFCSSIESEAESLIKGDLRADLESDDSEPPGKRRLIPKRARAYDDLIESIRREVGSRTDYLDGRQPAYYTIA
ncbi:hypothetical protein [Amycolatopsis sp. VC5-11]|uniref:hypothetical protein n=1 Tax=Amycolatopsis sp. VC5-11 TaxID=3120156 RepID=UPI0030088167